MSIPNSPFHHGLLGEPMAADLVLEIAERTPVGRPATLVPALVTVANQNPPLAPLHRPCDPILAAEQKIADLKVQIAPKPDSRGRSPFDQVRREAYGRTSIHISRSALGFCVRTVSDSPWDPGRTP